MKTIKILIVGPLPPLAGGIATAVSDLSDSGHSISVDKNTMRQS